MQDELKTAGIVALVGAALGGGLALGLGIRFFSAAAMVGLGAGVAIGVVAGSRPKRVSAEASPLLS